MPMNGILSTQIVDSKYHPSLKKSIVLWKRANLGAWARKVQNEPGILVCQEARECSTNDGTCQMVAEVSLKGLMNVKSGTCVQKKSLTKTN